MSKPVILTIDDSSAIRQAIREVLTEAGFIVIEAKTGKEGLVEMNGKDIHLILLDLNMPEINGYDFLKIIKTEPRYAKYLNTPVIILTTEIDKANKEKTKQLGAYGWIGKPFNPKSLVETVKEHCLKT